MPNGPSPDPRSGSVEERQQLEQGFPVCVHSIQVYSDGALYWRYHEWVLILTGHQLPTFYIQIIYQCSRDLSNASLLDSVVNECVWLVGLQLMSIVIID